MTPSLYVTGTYRGPSDRIMPRTQREAGIEFQGWEDRLKPLRSWASLIAIGLSVSLAIGAALALVLHCHDAGWLQ